MNLIDKIKYAAPQIELILLDNEISLALQSEPPVGPGELSVHSMPEMFNSNVLKTDLS